MGIGPLPPLPAPRRPGRPDEPRCCDIAVVRTTVMPLCRGCTGQRPVTGEASAPADPAFPVFFAVLDLLLRSGVTTVAEAAFQDHVWRPELDKLRNLAEIRVVHCTVDAGVAFDRITRREQDDPLRRVHAAAPRDGRARGGAPRVPPGERRRARARGRHERRIPSPVRPDPVLRGWTGELDSERAEVPASATLIAALGRAHGRPARRPPG